MSVSTRAIQSYTTKSTLYILPIALHNAMYYPNNTYSCLVLNNICLQLKQSARLMDNKSTIILQTSSINDYCKRLFNLCLYSVKILHRTSTVSAIDRTYNQSWYDNKWKRPKTRSAQEPQVKNLNRNTGFDCFDYAILFIYIFKQSQVKIIDSELEFK